MIDSNNIRSFNFISEKDSTEFIEYMNTWAEYSQEVKDAFSGLYNILASTPDVKFDFNIRPGVSTSFKSYLKKNDPRNPQQLFSVIDIIDQDPQNIWLSVCFYADMITDPDDLGNLIPKGLLEEDGYCFDVFEEDNALMDYLKIRIEEAHEKALVD